MANCERFELLISLTVDEEATLEERSQLEHHLASCPDCRAYYADMRRIRQAFICEDAVVPEGFSARLMDRVRETKQDPVQAEKKKTVSFPRWRRWGALAACCALAALCMWGIWRNDGRDAVIPTDSASQAESTAGVDMRSIDGGSALPAARSVDSADDEAVGAAVVSVEGPSQSIPDEYGAIVKSAAEEDGGEFQTQLIIQPAPSPTDPVPEAAEEPDLPSYERDMERTAKLDEIEDLTFTEDEAEQETDIVKAPDDPAAVPAQSEEPAEAADVPEPGIVTAFGSVAQSWVEDVLGLPWAGGGSYPLTAEQYGDLLRTLDEAGEPYRVEPGDCYCLMTE